jgi:lysine-N-methylase
MRVMNRALLNKCIDQARGAFGISPDGTVPDSYADDYKRYYEMYFADKEYVFENYIVNHIFAEGFPFNFRFEDNIMKNYNELLVKFNLIKFLLVGVSRHFMKFDKRRIVECVAAFSRAYDHRVGGALKMK